MTARLRLFAQAIAVGIVGALFALLVWKLVRDDGGLAPDVLRGETPPAFMFELPRLEGGGDLALTSYRGKVVVLNFWASWCGPCKEEAGELEAASRRWRDRGVVFVGVNAQDLRRDARRFVERYGVTYPNVYDGKGSTLGRFGVSGFPETFFVDRLGRVVSLVARQVTGDELDDHIERALAPA